MTDLCRLLSLPSSEYIEYLASLNVCEPHLVEEARKAGIVHAHLYLGIVPDAMSARSFKLLASKMPFIKSKGYFNSVLLPLVRPTSTLPSINEVERATLNDCIDERLKYIRSEILDADKAGAPSFKKLLGLSDEILYSWGGLLDSLRARYGLAYSNEPTGLPAISELMGLSAEAFYNHFGAETVPPETSGAFKRLGFRELLLGIVPVGVSKEEFIKCQHLFEDLTVTRVASIVKGWRINSCLLCPYLVTRHDDGLSISTGDELLHFLQFFGLEEDENGEKFDFVKSSLNGQYFSRGAVQPYITLKEVEKIEANVERTLRRIANLGEDMKDSLQSYFNVRKGLDDFLKDRYLGVFPTSVGSAKASEFKLKSFNSGYIPVQYLVDDFMALIHEMVDGKPSVPPGVKNYLKNEDIKYFAPYTAIVNSSCMGKSRFLFQKKCDKDYSTLMILFGCKDDTMPGKSAFYDNLITKIRTFPVDAQTKLLARTFVNILRIVRRRLFDKRGVFRTYASDVGAIMFDAITTNRRALNPISEDEYEKVLRDLDNLTDHEEPGDPEGAGHSKDSKGKGGKRMVLCFGFDEASALLEARVNARASTINQSSSKKGTGQSRGPCKDGMPVEEVGGTDNENSGIIKISVFRVMRRAFSYLATSYKCPCFFASTSSNISDFFPSIAYDPSRLHQSHSDAGSSVQQYLHRPLILQGTFDILARYRTSWQHVEKKKKGWYEHLQSKKHFIDLSYCGRPYWGSVMITGGNNHNEVLEAIRVKLHYQLKPQQNMERWTDRKSREDFRDGQLNSLWVIGRTGRLEPVGAGLYTYDLVDSRLAYLRSFNETTGEAKVDFISEPLLSCFAARELKKSPGLALELFNRVTRSPSIDLGAMGELAATLILVLAQYHASPVGGPELKCSDPSDKEVTDFLRLRDVGTFLEHLCLGNARIKEIQRREEGCEFALYSSRYKRHFEGAASNFCHWMYVKDKPRRKEQQEQAWQCEEEEEEEKKKKGKKGKKGKREKQGKRRQPEKKAARTDGDDSGSGAEEKIAGSAKASYWAAESGYFLRNMIRSGLQRNAGVALRRGFPLIDLAIPVCYKDTRQYGVILVQVKNRGVMHPKELRFIFDGMQLCWAESRVPIAHLILSLGHENYGRPEEIAKGCSKCDLAAHPDFLNVRFDKKPGNRPGMAILDYTSCLPLLYTTVEGGGQKDVVVVEEDGEGERATTTGGVRGDTAKTQSKKNAMIRARSKFFAELMKVAQFDRRKESEQEPEISQPLSIEGSSYPNPRNEEYFLAKRESDDPHKYITKKKLRSKKERLNYFLAEKKK